MSPRAFLILWGIPGLLFGCSASKKTSADQGSVIVVNTSHSPSDLAGVSGANQAGAPAIGPTRFDTLRVKYAHYLNTTPDQIRNQKLYTFIDYWLGTPYKWGGTDEKGIDCSAFIQRLLLQVYNIRVPRTSVQQFFTDWIDKFASTNYLSEGDLVFFCTINNTVISHVGMYLGNDMFISAASHGVTIANLKDPYWRKMFIGAGRVRMSMLKN
jgi:murein DD-endopeptidase / murein LD-carboxypeptidase